MSVSLGFKASDLHKKAEELRENDELDEAIKTNTKAIEEYKERNNWEGVSRALQSRVLIYKHKYLLTNQGKFLDLARKDAGESLVIAKEHNLEFLLGSCNFRFGEISMLSNDFKSAVNFYKNSVDLFIGPQAEKGDYLCHLGEALYKLGDKVKGRRYLLDGLSQIQNSKNEVDPFLIHVWESGCYMRLAECFKDDLGKSKGYMQKAKEIIYFDSKLVIRKRQWQKLADSFK